MEAEGAAAHLGAAHGRAARLEEEPWLHERRVKPGPVDAATRLSYKNNMFGPRDEKDRV